MNKLLVCLLFISCKILANDYHLTEEGKNFITKMQNEYGFAVEQVSSYLANAEKQQSILDAMWRPAEKVKTWQEYRPIFITKKRINDGAKFWLKHEQVLARAEREYGVSAQIIVAIIGVETFYGANTGKYRVLDALVTLGFDYPPRAPFFISELAEFLLLAREQQLDVTSVTGSYAGAMGVAQFISSSYRNFAVDFNGDGVIDLWNVEDAIGSVANYFKQHGWRSEEQVALQAMVKGERVQQALSPSLEPSITGKELRSFGWNGFSDAFNDYQVTAIQLEGDHGFEYWLGLPNFYVITRYNHSLMYAMAVYQLSEEIRSAKNSMQINTN